MYLRVTSQLVLGLFSCLPLSDNFFSRLFFLSGLFTNKQHDYEPFRQLCLR